jgi:hypothetical protein
MAGSAKIRTPRVYVETVCRVFLDRDSEHVDLAARLDVASGFVQIAHSSHGTRGRAP